MSKTQKAAMVITGVVAFSNLTQHDFYKGKDTGYYTLTITMDAENASKLEDAGVVVKDYEGKPQRKFKSQYTVDVIDAEDNPVEGEIPFGSEVRLLYTTGDAHPEHGVPVYLNKVRVLKRSVTEAPPEF